MAIEDHFITEVLRGRYAGALGAMLVVQAVLPPLVCAAFNILVNQTWNPVTLFHEATSGIRSPSWLLSLLWPSLCFLALTRLHVHHYTVSGHYSMRVWHVVRSLLRARSLLFNGALCACVCALTRHYAALAHQDFVSIVRPCYSSTTGTAVCINTRSVAALAAGVYCGLRHCSHYSLHNGSLVTTAAASVPKRQRLRAALTPRALLQRGLGVVWGPRGVLRSVVAVMVAYALLGGILEQWFASVLGSVHNNNIPLPSMPEQLLQPVVDTIHHDSSPLNHTQPATVEQSTWYITVMSWQRWQVLQDPMLFAVVMLVMVTVLVMMELFYEVFAIFVLQPISLPVSAPTDSSPDSREGQWVLGQALQSQHPTLHLLAFQALAKLGCTGGAVGSQAREAVFAISHPGGHPRNWSSLLLPTLNVIRTFTGRLMKQNCPEEYAATANQAQAAFGNNNNSVIAGANSSRLGATLGNTSLLAAAGNTSLLAAAGNTSLRAPAAGNTSMVGTAAFPATAAAPAVKVEEKKPSLVAGVRGKIVAGLLQKLSVVRRLPGVRFLLAELPDAANRQIFAEAQPVVWAVQGLCGIVSASFEEDHFGVVQRNMAEILTTLLQLNLILDKLGRPPLPKPYSSSVHGGVGLVGGSTAPHQLRRGVKLALRTSLYRLTHTFGPTILDVPLAPELKSRVKSYLDLMEG